jgi:diguanylate cyclase (GGDEF)-like protein
MAMNFILFFGYVLSLIPYRQYIGGRIYQVILFLGSLPLLGAITQILYFGTTMVWPMLALVAFATYVLIEREEIKKDGLTGLSTRSQLEERMLYLTRKRHKFSVMMVDLNKFKKINDNYGHDEGDKALKTIANILEKSIKQSDLVYRYAGDEFILLLETESKLTAKMVGERINNNLNKVNLSGNKPYKLSLSMGLAHYDGNLDIDIYDLISLADKEMYKNKKLKELEITE